MKIIQIIGFSLLGVSLLALSVTAHDQKQDSGLTNRYQNIEVGEFKVESGIDFPSDYQKDLPNAVVSKLRDLKKFKQVLQAGEAAL